MSAPLDPVQLTLDLVRIPSVSPDLSADGGEATIVRHVAGLLEQIGIQPELQPVDGQRCNVIGVLPGTAPGMLVFEAHLDTVPMPTVPCVPRLEDGRVWGRGACDTKASVAAMLTALEQLTTDPRPRPTVVFAGVVDEEYVMRGAAALADRLAGADGIVIGEPTNLRPVRAHNGCLRFEVRVRGITAHSSKAYLGRNAIVDAARLVVALEEQLGVALLSRPHVLTGSGLLTATEISGGTAPNVVPDACTVRFDRRLTPGETPASALEEVDAVVTALGASHGLVADRRDPWLLLPSVEMTPGHPLVTLAEAACSDALGEPVRSSGVPYCTDANVLTGQGQIPSIVLGPGSIDQAHAPVEWVDAEEIRRAVPLYASIAHRAAGGLQDTEQETP